MTSPYIITFTGRRFYPLAPREEDVCLEDIAHSLALQCRFTGHSRKPLSIAQHSVNVSNLCAAEHALIGLLHDASEAYICDISRPVKHTTEFAAYRAVEATLQACIYRAFGLAPYEPPNVKVADNIALGIEMRDLKEILEPEVLERHVEPVRNHLLSVKDPWDWQQSEREFLLRYYQLTYNSHAREGKNAG